MAIPYARPNHAATAPESASAIDRLAARSYDGLLLAARIALGGIFVLSGYGKLMGLAAFSASLASHGVPAAWLWGPIGAAVEFGGGMLIVLGLATHYAALVMILFVIVATLISHRFWDSVDPQQFKAQQTQFLKNLAIAGGFVLLFATAGGRLAIDSLLRRHPGG